jgi:hypothetical protein
MHVNGEIRLVHALTEWFFDFLPRVLSRKSRAELIFSHDRCAWLRIEGHAQVLGVAVETLP